jgi:hypothetical protein
VHRTLSGLLMDLSTASNHAFAAMSRNVPGTIRA